MSKHYSKEEIKKIFKRVDNGNGHLSLAEIDKAVPSLFPNSKINKNAIIRAFKSADASGNGFVELREFEKVLRFLEYYNQLSQVFDTMDTDDDHKVSFEEFKQGFEAVGEDTSDGDYLRKEFNRIDKNKGGSILFDEFCAYMANKKLE